MTTCLTLNVLAAVATCPGRCTVAGVTRLIGCSEKAVARARARGYLDRDPAIGLILTEEGAIVLENCGIETRVCRCGAVFEVDIFSERTRQVHCSKACSRAAYDARMAAE